MKKCVFLALLLASTALFAGSVRLYNDSPYKLRAVVRAADGSYVGEMILLPQTFNTWTDSYNEWSPGPARSQTPYTIHWYCIEGGEYGICTNVSTGATVVASGCDGTRMCKPQAQQEQNAGDEEESLDDQNALPNPTTPSGFPTGPK
jgi:hypothetical protein